jgi:hypothetical protein
LAYSQYFAGLFSFLAPNAAVTDLTPPTFAGITGNTPNTDGSISVAWSLASDATPPIEYLVYIALGSVSAATLFQTTNLTRIAPAGSTSTKIFLLADQTTYLVNGQQYTVGVRAKDAVGNIDSNTVIQTPTAIASGNLPVVLQTLATDLDAVLTAAQTTLESISSAGGTSLTAELEIETVLDVEEIESV